MGEIEIREYHDDARVVIVRNGMEMTKRPYTAEENAAADAKKTLLTNEATLNADTATALNSLATAIATLQAIIDKPNTEITAGDTKTVARETIRVARQVLRLTRLWVKAFDTAVV